MKSHLNFNKLPSTGNLTTAVPAFAAALGAMAVGWLLLWLLPSLSIEFFARGAAEIAAKLSGVAVVRVANGWMLFGATHPVVVTEGCSATDYFLIVTVLLSWQGARRGMGPYRAALAGLFAALPLAIGVNALRVVVVAQMHRWIIPMFPEAYGHFLHLLAGVAVFLPALIALNLLLENHARPRTTS